MRRRDVPHLVLMPGGASGARRTTRSGGGRMSGRLVGEVAEWLMSPAADGMSPAERTVLLLVAERAHEKTRVMLRHRTDDRPLVDRLAAGAGLDKGESLKKAFQRLAKRGMEVRIPIGEDKLGRPRFAHEGRSMGFRLPELPASVQLPEWGESVPPTEPVDNPVDDSDSISMDEAQRGEPVPSTESRGGNLNPPSGAQRGESVPPLSPSKSIPSKTFYPSRGLPSSLADVEVPASDPPQTIEEPIDQAMLLAAQSTLLQMPDGGVALLAAATSELPDASHQRHIVLAASLARRTA